MTARKRPESHPSAQDLPELTLGAASSMAEDGLIPGSPGGEPKQVAVPPPSLKRETCIILTFMAFLMILTGAVLSHFERKRRRKHVISIQHAFVYSSARPASVASVPLRGAEVNSLVLAGVAVRVTGKPV